MAYYIQVLFIILLYIEKNQRTYQMSQHNEFTNLYGVYMFNKSNNSFGLMR